MPSTLKAFYGRQETCPVLSLKGEVRYVNVSPLRTFVDDIVVDECDGAIVVDLRGVDSIDSTGMGLIARLGRVSLAHGRRSVLVCNNPDVMLCLKSSAFDKLFILETSWPFEREASVVEIPLRSQELKPTVMGRLMLEAHQDLASLSEENERAFAGVIASLRAELTSSEDKPS